MRRSWCAYRAAVLTACAVAACNTNAAPQSGANDAAGGDADAALATGIDPDSCFPCGTEACPGEAAACEQSAQCFELVRCMLDCAADAACLARCDTSQVTPQELMGIFSFSGCAARTCADACTPETRPNDPGPNTTPTVVTSTGKICTSDGERTGSCVTDSLLLCRDNLWLRDPCLVCRAVTPRSACTDVQLLTIESATEDTANPVATNDPDAELALDGDTVQAEWSLEPNQIGVMRFEFVEGVDPTRIELEGPGATVGSVTLETPDGASGCRYALDETRLIRSSDSTNANDPDSGCWGEFEELVDAEPTTATIMKLSTPVSSSKRTQRILIDAVRL